MSKQNILMLAENFRQAILYLIQEAYKSGLDQMGKSLEEAERTIDCELNSRGLSREKSKKTEPNKK